jgi:hypothetical protein
MSSNDRQDDQTPPHDPLPEAQADAREQAQAASFAALLDRLTSGHALPPAMTAEERALVETAGMVRASARPVALAQERQRALIDAVLGAAPMHGAARESGAAEPAHGGVDVARGARDHVPSRAPGRDGLRAGEDGVIDMASRRRGRFFRALPWAVAVVSAAAALLALWQTRGGPLSPAGPDVVAENAPALDSAHRSRPADALIGEIPRPAADAARARIDMIYADRLIGYRDLRLRGDRL